MTFLPQCIIKKLLILLTIFNTDFGIQYIMIADLVVNITFKIRSTRYRIVQFQVFFIVDGLGGQTEWLPQAAHTVLAMPLTSDAT
jgi:hypothetical protein